MKCSAGHEHDKLSCPTCAEIKGHTLAGERLIAAIANGTKPIRFNGHVTLRADSWRKIAKEFNIGLTKAVFPVLCGNKEYALRSLRSMQVDHVDDCPGCDSQLSKLHEKMRSELASTGTED